MKVSSIVVPNSYKPNSYAMSSEELSKHMTSRVASFLGNKDLASYLNPEDCKELMMSEQFKNIHEAFLRLKEQVPLEYKDQFIERKEIASRYTKLTTFEQTKYGASVLYDEEPVEVIELQIGSTTLTQSHIPLKSAEKFHFDIFIDLLDLPEPLSADQAKKINLEYCDILFSPKTDPETREQAFYHLRESLPEKYRDYMRETLRETLIGETKEYFIKEHRIKFCNFSIIRGEVR